jgi:hypothetical protein
MNQTIESGDIVVKALLRGLGGYFDAVPCHDDGSGDTCDVFLERWRILG